MSQSLAKILVHTVFSTKERRPFLRDQALREDLHRYVGAILRNLKCQPIIVGGIEDHVHLLCSLSRTCEAAVLVKEVKRGSSLWLKKSPVFKTLAGKTVTGSSPSVFRKPDPCVIILRGRRSIIAKFPFRMSFGSC